MKQIEIPIFLARIDAPRGNWLSPLQLTRMEREPVQQSRSAQKAEYYRANRDAIRAKVNERRRLARLAKGKK